jgi:hypothetical protein
MRRAVAVVRPPGQLAAPDRLPGGAARHRGRVDQPDRVVPARRLPGQVIHRRGQQRRRGLEPLVVAGLMRQVGEQMAQPPVAHPQPVMLRPRTQQYLGHGQAHQLGIGQLFRLAPATASGRDHVIVDLHVQCRQEGVQVVRHSRSSSGDACSTQLRSRLRHPAVDRTVMTDVMWWPRIPHSKDRAARRDPVSRIGCFLGRRSGPTSQSSS